MTYCFDIRLVLVLRLLPYNSNKKKDPWPSTLSDALVLELDPQKFVTARERTLFFRFVRAHALGYQRCTRGRAHTATDTRKDSTPHNSWLRTTL